VPTVEPGATNSEVTVQIHLWSGIHSVSFNRAECWKQIGGATGDGHGFCTFSVMVNSETVPEPGASAMAAGLIAVAILSRRRHEIRKHRIA
jgi:uncharacterized protein (TIGR03382 family)